MKTILTCGHSARSFDEFIELLMSNRVTLLVDVRSKPYSRWVPHFNRGYLEVNLPILYAWEPDLGGLTAIDPIAFDRAIERVIRYAKRYTVCLMCSEKDPAKCHRSKIIEPALEERGVRVIHI